MKKKKYYWGRKHKQFYVSFNEKTGNYVIEPFDVDLPFEQMWKVMVEKNYLFSGSYAECNAFKKGFDYGYSIHKLIVKKAIERTVNIDFDDKE